MSNLHFLYISVAFATIIVFKKCMETQLRNFKYRHIPGVRSRGLIESYITPLAFLFRGGDLILEGYRTYHGRVFKVPLLYGWHFVLAGADLIEDFRKAPEDVLSFQGLSENFLQTDYTFGKSIRTDPYHVSVVQGPLTRNLETKMAEMYDEVESSFRDAIPSSKEWHPISVGTLLTNVVARTSNRVFVGLPLCRNVEYLNTHKRFSIYVMISARITSIFPESLRRFVGEYMTPVTLLIMAASRHLYPIIEERLQKITEGGPDYPGKPNDLLSWLIDEAQTKERRNALDLVRRILTVNFASIHSTSLTCLPFIFCLAAYPEYIDELREEVETTIDAEGWSKSGLKKMKKLDSFLKEAERYAGGMGVLPNRLVLRDFTFSDGTTLPAGSVVGIPSCALYHDESYYPEPEKFLPFRFVNLREEDHEDHKYQLVSISPEYPLFGVGRPVCPGRFFAACQLKMIVAHILLTYDLKFENEGRIPDSMWFGTLRMPNRAAKILFRNRQT